MRHALSSMVLSVAAALSLLGPCHVQAAVEANHATALDLESIKGIGPATASKILEQRNRQRFENWQDFIRRVPGVGEKKATRMSDHGLTVNGQRFGPQTATTAAPRDKPQLPPDPFPAGSMLVEWPQRRP